MNSVSKGVVGVSGQFLLGQLEASVSRAITEVAKGQDARGAWYVLPDARIFETALVGLALSRAGGAEPEVARAREVVASLPVQQHHPVPAAVETGLADLLLSSTTGPIDLSDPSFRTEVFSSRARLMQVVALHQGRAALSPWTEAELREGVAAAWARCADSQQKQWSKVELASMHVLLQTRHGDAAAAREAAACLPALQSPNGSFCDNVVSTSMALFALSAALPGSECWRRCRQHLLDARQADGSWRFCASDVWDTTLMVRAWAGAPGFERATQAAVRFLVRAQNDDGGWAFLSGLESDSDTTASALLALEGRADCSSSIERALRYLAQRQLEDGLWRTWHFKGDPPTPDVVAHIVAALERHPGRHAIRTAPAVRWLAGLFTGGGWQAGWYRGLPYAVLEIGRALPAASAVRRAATMALVEQQNADGGFGHQRGEASFAGPTGLALAAMLEALPVDDPRVTKALRFLLANEQDGRWPGCPEMFGPRPMLSHFKTHTQAFVGFGLVAASRKLASLGALLDLHPLAVQGRSSWAE
ncbi:MAG: prenyltransferase/squalene oxidase repeat-containing protein [Archangium sp.]|nr:prenyltransferase/squalene oxidase repeat-containing protein [Archangium sp.]